EGVRRLYNSEILPGGMLMGQIGGLQDHMADLMVSRLSDPGQPEGPPVHSSVRYVTPRTVEGEDRAQRQEMRRQTATLAVKAAIRSDPMLLNSLDQNPDDPNGEPPRLLHANIMLVPTTQSQEEHEALRHSDAFDGLAGNLSLD